jgi:hypothetical protein
MDNIMKECRINFRVSASRYNKIRNYAIEQDKTITQLIEGYVDSLPDTKIDYSTTSKESPDKK